MEDKKSQMTRLLNYLEKHGSITSIEALEQLGIARCSSRIWDLKRVGYPIERRMETGLNRYGQKTSYARYYYENTL